ncbi:MAG: hypothetical protein JXP48_00570 [Acidobacteria bacterium]|nr:hypothetical protein [Acidobacteriota bacterium]
MILALDTWLLPAIAAGSSSYLVSLLWERVRPETAPERPLSAFLAALSFLMGALAAGYRHAVYAPGPENNIIVMFVAGASATFFWLLLRRHLPGWKDRNRDQGNRDRG